MRIGIQGLAGSATDAAAALLVEDESAEFVYLTDAEGVLAALRDGTVELGVLALESPLGIPVPETAVALPRYPAFEEIAELRTEVRHCIMVKPGESGEVRYVASHPIPLEKHREFLEREFPGYQPIPLADTGLAAEQLSASVLPPHTAVIAMKRAADLFGLSVIRTALPKNDNYQSKFVLLKRADRSPAS